MEIYGVQKEHVVLTFCLRGRLGGYRSLSGGLGVRSLVHSGVRLVSSRVLSWLRCSSLQNAPLVRNFLSDQTLHIHAHTHTNVKGAHPNNHS